MKNVRTRILSVICGLVAVSLLTLGIVSIVLNNQTTSGVLEQTMLETAKIAAERVSNNIWVYKTIVSNAGLDADISNPNATIEQKQQALDDIVATNHDMTRGGIIGTDGIGIFNGTDYNDREYFKNAMNGKAWVSEPLVAKTTGAVSVIVAAPIWQDGKPNTTVIGVIFLVPKETFLNDIVSNIKVSPNAGAAMISKAGTTIAHPNMDLVANYNNNQENEKTDSSYKAVAALERDAMKGGVGFGRYTMFGVDKFMAYAPVPDSDGWSINVNAPIDDFMSYTNKSILYTAILLAVFLVVSVLFAVYTAGKIGKPLSYLSEILSNIAKTGSVELDEDYRQKEREMLARKDEIGSIATAVEGLLSMLVHDAGILNTIANGDLTVDVQPLSDKDALGGAMQKMTANLNSMFTGINRASEQVSSGSRQIANGSQSLAQGSTQQAAAVEQLSSSITQIASKTKENAEMAERAAGLASSIKDSAEKGSRQMDEMVTAVREISEASQSINQVIKVIDDIAFQTNILALNAAVEAARAGQHGKGFAVVADEVRNLASKSSEAAKDTSGLIANSMEKAELGARIVGETAASLGEIVTGINESNKIVAEIARSSAEQSVGITQVNKGIDQVAQVVQQNSATAQQSAAASEEMSGQAAILEDLVEQFKLKDGGNSKMYLGSGM